MRVYLSTALILCLLCTLATNGCAAERDGANSSILDLTAMSGTMVYTTVQNMMQDPSGSIGRTIKASGSYYAEYYADADRHYHYMIIESAVGCCPQGLEFIWSGEHVYPDDFPEENTMIEITGVFSSYEEFGETWYYLSVLPDELNIIPSQLP